MSTLSFKSQHHIYAHHATVRYHPPGPASAHVELPLERLKLLYWTDGPLEYQLITSEKTPAEPRKAALELIAEFQSRCREKFAALVVSETGREIQHKSMLALLRTSPPGKLAGFPVSLKESPGGWPPGVNPVGISEQESSRLSRIRAEEWCEMLRPGGVVERDQCKFFLSSVFSLWEHDVRKPIARIFDVPPYAITCDLMGDIRLVRNDFEHNDGMVSKEGGEERTPFLRELWGIEVVSAEYWQITSQMIQALMRQIASIHIKVGFPLTKDPTGLDELTKLSEVPLTEEAIGVFLLALGVTVATSTPDSQQYFLDALKENIENMTQAAGAHSNPEKESLRELHSIVAEITADKSPMIQAYLKEAGLI